MSDLDGIGQGMAEMQRACDIRWWDDDDKWGLAIVLVARLEEALLLPPIIPVHKLMTPSFCTHVETVIKEGLQGTQARVGVSLCTLSEEYASPHQLLAADHLQQCQQAAQCSHVKARSQGLHMGKVRLCDAKA